MKKLAITSFVVGVLTYVATMLMSTQLETEVVFSILNWSVLSALLLCVSVPLINYVLRAFNKRGLPPILMFLTVSIFVAGFSSVALMSSSPICPRDHYIAPPEIMLITGLLILSGIILFFRYGGQRWNIGIPFRRIFFTYILQLLIGTMPTSVYIGSGWVGSVCVFVFLTIVFWIYYHLHSNEDRKDLEPSP